MRVFAAGIRLSRLAEVSTEDVLDLLNDPGIARHMPLAGDRFDEAAARQWADGKDAQWQQNGYGPWAVIVGDEFAGWSGFQKEGQDADFAMVLKPRFWGLGREIYVRAVGQGFDALGFESIVVTLPPTRKVARVLGRLGFHRDGETEHWGRRFLRFRLLKHDWERFARA